MIVDGKTCCDFCAREATALESAVRTDRLVLCRDCVRHCLECMPGGSVDEIEARARSIVGEGACGDDQESKRIRERGSGLACGACGLSPVEIYFYDGRAMREKGAPLASLTLLCHGCAAKARLSAEGCAGLPPKPPWEDSCSICGRRVGQGDGRFTSKYSRKVVCWACLRSLDAEEEHGAIPRRSELCQSCMVRDRSYLFFEVAKPIVPRRVVIGLCEECFDRLGFIHPDELPGGDGPSTRE